MQSVPITTVVESLNPTQAWCTQYNIMWYSLSVTYCGRLVVYSWYSGFFHQLNWPPLCNWNIIESGIKHHNPPPCMLGISIRICTSNLNNNICKSKIKEFLSIYLFEWEVHEMVPDCEHLMVAIKYLLQYLFTNYITQFDLSILLIKCLPFSPIYV